MAGRLPDDCLTTAWWLPDDCLMTAWQLPDDCLTTDWQLPVDCLMTVSWLPNDCPMTARWLPHDSLMTEDDWWKPHKYHGMYLTTACWSPDDLITAWQSNYSTYIIYWFSWFSRKKNDQILTLSSLADWLAGTWLNCTIQCTLCVCV